MQILTITPDRFKVVYKEISDGSEPALRFYILVAISTLIAGFGLIANSIAVVIGAMLVAPLMTPIFGISLALVRGESDLLGKAARAEIVGVVAAVSMGFVLGSLIGEIEPTSEMLSRTRPNLFDLIVAVLAGFAGAYALVDEKISPALPGVAIATAIVPPLANSGLCLALGEFRGGIGSFLFFFANFLSILVVASGTFILSGMAKQYGVQANHIDYARRFALPIVAFVLIAGFLGHSLMQIYKERWMAKTITNTLIDSAANLPATYLGQVDHYSEDGTLHVLATVHSPTFLRPTQVTLMQNQLSERIGMPTELLMRCIISNNVSALGSVKHVVKTNLDGTFVKVKENDIISEIATTEQIIREYFATDNALDLIRVDPIVFSQRKFMIAHVLGIRQLSSEEITMLENLIREATGEKSLYLSISSIHKSIQSSDGILRYGWILGNQGTPEVRERISQVRADLKSFFAKDVVYELVNVDATYLDDKFHFLMEIVGPEIYPHDMLKALESQLARAHSEPIELYAWSRVEVIHGTEGPLSRTGFLQTFNDRQKENLPDEIPFMLEASSR